MPDFFNHYLSLNFLADKIFGRSALLIANAGCLIARPEAEIEAQLGLKLIKEKSRLAALKLLIKLFLPSIFPETNEIA